MIPMRHPHAPKGFSLIEAMIALVVLLLGAFGLMGLQLASARANNKLFRESQATSLATDLAESMRRWSYDDSRLAPWATVSSLDAPEVVQRWNMGGSARASYVAEFGDTAQDPNATVGAALGPTFRGLSTDTDRDGRADYIRYWNVFEISSPGSSLPEGKLVQIIVRWNSSGPEHKQVTNLVFKRNPSRGL